MFVGLSVLDILYRLESSPRPNSKNVVRERGIFAGGPAANASVTFAALGGEARLVTAIGSHPLGGLIRDDLETHGVEVEDRIPDFDGVPSVASVMVSPDGDRLVASTAAHSLPEPAFDFDLGEPDVVLVDGHLLDLCIDGARRAREAGIPVVADCGSWKSGCERMLPYVDIAICAEDFLPPDAENPVDVFAFLRRYDVKLSAITRGEKPVLIDGGEPVDVPQAKAVDTLGAGDVFHGAFCYELAAGVEPFSEQLRRAAQNRLAGLRVVRDAGVDQRVPSGVADREELTAGGCRVSARPYPELVTGSGRRACKSTTARRHPLSRTPRLAPARGLPLPPGRVKRPSRRRDCRG